MVFDPIHYLPLLEQKIGALDQAAPLVGWSRSAQQCIRVQTRDRILWNTGGRSEEP